MIKFHFEEEVKQNKLCAWDDIMPEDYFIINGTNTDLFYLTDNGYVLTYLLFQKKLLMRCYPLNNVNKEFFKDKKNLIKIQNITKLALFADGLYINDKKISDYFIEDLEELTFDMVENGQFFIDGQGDLCQKSCYETYQKIANNDQIAFTAGLYGASGIYKIKKIFPKCTKIEF